MNHSFFSSWYSHSISRHFLILLHFLFLSATASIDWLTIYVQYCTHQFIWPKSSVPSNIKELEPLSAEQIWAELWTDDIRFIKQSFIRSFHRRTEVPQELSLQIQHSLILPLREAKQRIYSLRCAEIGKLPLWGQTRFVMTRVQLAWLCLQIGYRLPV